MQYISHYTIKYCQYCLTNEVKMNNFGPNYPSYYYFHNQIHRPQCFILVHSYQSYLVRSVFSPSFLLLGKLLLSSKSNKFQKLFSSDISLINDVSQFDYLHTQMRKKNIHHTETVFLHTHTEHSQYKHICCAQQLA